MPMTRTGSSVEARLSYGAEACTTYRDGRQFPLGPDGCGASTPDTASRDLEAIQAQAATRLVSSFQYHPAAFELARHYRDRT